MPKTLTLPTDDEVASLTTLLHMAKQLNHLIDTYPSYRMNQTMGFNVFMLQKYLHLSKTQIDKGLLGAQYLKKQYQHKYLVVTTDNHLTYFNHAVSQKNNHIIYNSRFEKTDYQRLIDDIITPIKLKLKLGDE